MRAQVELFGEEEQDTLENQLLARFSKQIFGGEKKRPSRFEFNLDLGRIILGKEAQREVTRLIVLFVRCIICALFLDIRFSLNGIESSNGKKVVENGLKEIYRDMKKLSQVGVG